MLRHEVAVDSLGYGFVVNTLLYTFALADSKCRIIVLLPTHLLGLLVGACSELTLHHLKNADAKLRGNLL